MNLFVDVGQRSAVVGVADVAEGYLVGKEGKTLTAGENAPAVPMHCPGGTLAN